MSSEGDETKEFPCLVRVSDGKDAKFSTTVCAPHCSDLGCLNQVSAGSTVRSREFPRDIWGLAQVIDEHSPKARQEARKAACRGICAQETTSARGDRHRGPEAGERSAEEAEEDQGCAEAGGVEEAGAGAGGGEGTSKGVLKSPGLYFASYMLLYHQDHFRALDAVNCAPLVCSPPVCLRISFSPEHLRKAFNSLSFVSECTLPPAASATGSDLGSFASDCIWALTVHCVYCLVPALAAQLSCFPPCRSSQLPQ